MGNCTSKKSLKLSKITLSSLPLGKKMDKTQGSKNDVRALSKVAPTSKGEATSFGFKRRPGSGIPAPARAPVTLTSRVNEMRHDAQSGSSVESLCHVANSASPVVSSKATPSPTPSQTHQRRRTPSPGMGAANRFGFRSATPPKGARHSPGPRLQTTPKSSPATVRSRSAVGAREARAAFFRDVMQPCPSGSANSIMDSQVDVADARNPGKFWLQTNQLPRPQYPIRLHEKAFKTHANTCRRDGDASKDNSVTDDSGLGSQPARESDTDNLHGLQLSDSSPTSQPRGRAPRKLEMRIVSENKFELLDKNEGRKTTTPFVKAPRSAPSTGLVQQRTQQYLQRISSTKDSNRTAPLADCSYMISPGASTESEEEKLTRDACRSEKNKGGPCLMSEGSGEIDELLPGEAMADEITLSFSSDEDFSVCKYESTIEAKNSVMNKNAVAIRSDALRLSNQLRRESASSTQMDYSCSGLLNAEERAVLDEDALLELSSESETSAAVKHRAQANATPVNVTLNTSTESPGTPSNGSMSEGRDFLIDDEIADQPQLCFSTHEDLNLDKVLTENNNNLSEIHTQNIQLTIEKTVAPEERQIRRVSVGTLSPCESLLSDDLMMEFENSDENIDRLEGSLGDNGCLDEQPWGSITRMRSSPGTNGKIGGSSTGSPASHKSGVSRASTDEDLSLRLDKTTCQHMFQDIVSIKAMLLKLNKVLSEGDGVGGECFEEDPTLDLKKQVAFLQQQLQQRENSVQILQAEVNRVVDGRPQPQPHPPTLCNAATQTDKVRPASTAPSALHSLPSDTNVVSNGTNKKVAEWIEDNNRRESMMRIAPAEKILEKVKELNFIPVNDVKEPRAGCGKNVFKITKIDLVLKSDNYGQSELRKS